MSNFGFANVPHFCILPSWTLPEPPVRWHRLRRIEYFGWLVQYACMPLLERKKLSGNKCIPFPGKCFGHLHRHLLMLSTRCKTCEVLPGMLARSCHILADYDTSKQKLYDANILAIRDAGQATSQSRVDAPMAWLSQFWLLR